MSELAQCFNCCSYLFFFQAEDGIRDDLVTGVQTCALPISTCLLLTVLNNRLLPGSQYALAVVWVSRRHVVRNKSNVVRTNRQDELANGQVRQIGRASCRERV